MRVDQSGLEFIARWEGTVLHVYKDVVGIPTIGVGHVLLPGESYPHGISRDEALAILAKDVAKCESAIGRYVTVPLNQNQFNALASFTFNCGVGALQKSTVLRKLNAGDYHGAADALLMWCKAGGKPNQGLLNRRRDERKLFLTPVVSIPSVAQPEQHHDIQATPIPDRPLIPDAPAPVPSLLQKLLQYLRDLLQ